jgi:hypothetical protein
MDIVTEMHSAAEKHLKHKRGCLKEPGIAEKRAMAMALLLFAYCSILYCA